jgi:hypothetical protein
MRDHLSSSVKIMDGQFHDAAWAGFFAAFGPSVSSRGDVFTIF